jgi:hypothetical protein
MSGFLGALAQSLKELPTVASMVVAMAVVPIRGVVV